MSHLETLIDRLEGREALVAVVGLGYVGLPVAASFAEAGFRVVGVDVNADRVAALNEGRSYLPDVSDSELAELKRIGRLRGTSSFKTLKDADAILICVPTPIKDGAPDLSHVLAAGEAVGKVLKPGALVVLESTTYPGTTDELLAPLLEKSGLRLGKEMFLAFSPERIDPGNTTHAFGDIPKVVGGVDEASTRAASALYAQVVPKVFPVSGAREAELAKLIENTFRHVNIALINELAVYAHEMGIDVWEAIDAAATKPFGFLPFYPGPGWGGHCIPLDPAYLSWRVRRDRAHEVRFVELAHTMNAEMPRYVAERVGLMLNDRGKAVRDARILCVGAAYKSGTDDIRESGAIKVAGLLARRGARLSYHDPLVPELELGGRKLRSVRLGPKSLRDQDLVVLLVPQVGVDWDLIRREAPFVFDVCNVLNASSDRIVKL